MSDYDYDVEGGHSFDILPIIVVALVLGVIGWFILPPMFFGEHQKDIHANDYQTLGQQTQKLLNDPTITCEQIQNMRQLHIQVQNSWQDPLYWESNFDTARDLWNAKNCGNHWGWFES